MYIILLLFIALIPFIAIYHFLRGGDSWKKFKEEWQEAWQEEKEAVKNFAAKVKQGLHDKSIYRKLFSSLQIFTVILLVVFVGWFLFHVFSKVFFWIFPVS
jgi:hypothetical protein